MLTAWKEKDSGLLLSSYLFEISLCGRNTVAIIFTPVLIVLEFSTHRWWRTSSRLGVEDPSLLVAFPLKVPWLCSWFLLVLSLAAGLFIY